ncbi:1-aminocyclopropane-1-carboxylate deaminase/D-cysteine desulfhydrase [Algoriphagus hitonicola]|uniref:Pyridoxal-phosphate dependent enzyme n=1 Tax=Algoriphagus hitonicola TaxID=435880 RepID=A0A1I2RZF8_9BACT|nr:pyridoxal-phosphate dependent enzyme [Algoriphagus hitonicola]SFG45443.1 Pyridoxal-phosphate dependent enzyme [Algoriphagus hitonicola]
MLVANPIINQPLDHPILEKSGIGLSIKRLDWVHPEVSGNKFFKLKYNLEQAQKQSTIPILTFGGAYSNHIQATAAAANSLNLKSIGVIRGEETLPLNPTLEAAQKNGMKFHYLNRSDYRKKTSPEILKDFRERFGEYYLIPEGGTNSFAIKGTAEILEPEDHNFDLLTVSIGTGGTFAGILNQMNSQQKLLGFSALKGEFIHAEIQLLLEKYDMIPKGKYEIITAYHFGGYANYQQALIDFIWWFYEQFGIPLDPIYTGKHFFGIWDKIEKGEFPKGTKILSIHTGGLQGIAGFTERTGIKLPPLSG